MLLRCERLETLMSQMGHQLPLGLGVECFRFTPVSGLYLKLIDWPKGARSRPDQSHQLTPFNGIAADDLCPEDGVS
jgi:hypothetical protein